MLVQPSPPIAGLQPFQTPKCPSSITTFGQPAPYFARNTPPSRHFPESSRISHLGRVHATSMEKPEVESTGGKVEWFKKQKELWVEPEDKEALLELIENNDSGKPIVLDCYAGWCSSCKSAYPALCKIASNEDHRKNFLFAKADIQVPGVIGFIRSHGVKGIPTIMVFDPTGELLATFGASFRKINMVKANLVVMAANAGSKFRVDPNGFVIPKPED
ncbi:hypothetical protein BSKO_14135 [Bryopsis sp. KO-2023]|nr:hypothetical protein BSKO_14135 [Bryopsis sp. KO-2023]